MKKVSGIAAVCISVVFVVLAFFIYMKPGVVEAEGQMVGYVDSDRVLEGYDKAAAVNKELADMKKKSEADLEKSVKEKFGSGDLNALPRESQLEIQKMIDSAEKNFDKKSDELRKAKWEPIVKRVNETIGKVAQQEKLQVVLDKGAVLYGGVDITDKVAKQLSDK